MRFTTSLIIGLLLATAGTAQAREKKVDLTEISAKAGFNSPTAGSLTAMSPTYDRIYATGLANAPCSTPTLDSANNGMYYDIYCLQTDDTNPVELILDINGTNIIDAVMTLYCTPFDPMQPDQNVVAYDDDSGVATLSAITVSHSVVLEPGQEYFLVISTYGAGMTGDYVIQKSSNVFDCGAVANGHANWGSLKGQYR